MSPPRPSLRVERSWQRQGYRLIAGMDEVGRGALAGPVSVGMVVIGEMARSAPSGVRDSKLLTAQARERLVPKIQRWALAWAVGHAEPEEIDAIGIMAALRLAAHRAMDHLGMRPDLILLDGNHDWFTEPGELGLLGFVQGREPPPPVATLVKADRKCSTVAAASVLAKVTRDRIVVDRDPDHPGYGWCANKGYAAPEHLDALRRLGPTAYHRRSWRLPLGIGEDGDDES